MDPDLKKLISTVFFCGEWEGVGGIPLNPTLRPVEEDVGTLGDVEADPSPRVASIVVEANGLQGVRTYESAFGDTTLRSRLPTGARTLYTTESGEIAVRGLNKFPDIEDISYLLESESLHAVVTPEIIQRKLAGFICLVAVYNGELLVSSKHTLAGKHSGVASELLKECWGERESEVIRFLENHDACLVCECVDPRDGVHPVDEGGYQGVTLLTVVKASARRETTLPHLMQEAAATSGLRTVKEHPLTWRLLREAVRRAAMWGGAEEAEGEGEGEGEDTALPYDALSEGWVATFSLPARHVAECFGGDILDPTKVYFRVKIKQLRYKVQRRLRQRLETVLQGETPVQSLVDNWRQMAVHEKIVFSHLFATNPKTPIQSITSIVDRVINEGGKEVGEVFKAIRPVLPAHAHTLVLTVGLPGSGKSTLLGQMCAHIMEHKAHTVQVVVLSRDEITASLRAEHSKRDVARATHQTLDRIVQRLLQHSHTPCLIFIDGCHLAAGARTQLARQFARCAIINVRCRVDLCADRVLRRSGHLTLPGVAASKDVVLMMAGKLQYHTQQRGGGGGGGGGNVHCFNIDTNVVDKVTGNRTADALLSLHLASGFVPQIDMASRTESTLITTADIMSGTIPDGSSTLANTDAALKDFFSKKGVFDGNVMLPVAVRAASLAYVGVMSDCCSDWCSETTAIIRRLSNMLPTMVEREIAGLSSDVPAFEPYFPRLTAFFQQHMSSARYRQNVQCALYPDPDTSLLWLHGDMKKRIYKHRMQQEAERLRGRAGQEGAQTPSAPKALSIFGAFVRHYNMREYLSPERPLHCTLQYFGKRFPGSESEVAVELLQKECSLDGSVCLVSCDALLCDGKALCLSVCSISRFTGWFGARFEPIRIPGSQSAHITLGTSDGVPPRYAHTLASNIAKWAEENETSRKRRKACSGAAIPVPRSGEEEGGGEEEEEEVEVVSRKRKKRASRQHNFARVVIAPPIVLSGVVKFVGA